MTTYFVRLAFIIEGVLVEKVFDNATHIGFTNSSASQVLTIEEFFKLKPTVNQYNSLNGARDFLEIGHLIRVAFIFFESKV